MKNNLKTKGGRIDAIQNIENSFIASLRKNNFDVATDAVCRIGNSSIALGIESQGDDKTNGFKTAFASEIDLYAANPDKTFGRKENEINFGSSGCFTPNVRESYWRTIHAASILKNWDKACELINEHCKMYSDLVKEIHNQNES